MARTIDRKHETAAIVADGGPAKAPLGEMSLAVAAALNPGGKAPNLWTGEGAPKNPVQYVVFPGSAADPSWPSTWEKSALRQRDCCTRSADGRLHRRSGFCLSKSGKRRAGTFGRWTEGRLWH